MERPSLQTRLKPKWESVPKNGWLRMEKVAKSSSSKKGRREGFSPTPLGAFGR